MSAPQFWVAIMLIMLFAAQWKLLPAFGKGGIDHYILPAFSISLFIMAGFMRLTRSSMLDCISSAASDVYKRQVLTFGGVSFAGLLNGSIVVEVVFAWPGIGLLMLGGIRERDVNVILATVLTSGLLYILLSTIVDLLYAYVDPRIRYG